MWPWSLRPLGLGPGRRVVALGISFLAADYFFLAPRYSIWAKSRENLLGLDIYALAGLAILFFAARLRRAKEIAEEANRVKSQFLARVSHELRTPMNAVLGMMELAFEEEGSPTVRDYLQTAQDAAQGLLSLLNELLDFAKIDAGKLALDPTPFRLHKLLAEVVRTLDVIAQEKGIALCLDIAPTVPDTVIGDPLRLRQVLMNLVGNAIKFTEHGRVMLRAYLHTSMSAAGLVEFACNGQWDWDCSRSPRVYLYSFRSGGGCHSTSLRGHWPGFSDLKEPGGDDGWTAMA